MSVALTEKMSVADLTVTGFRTVKVAAICIGTGGDRDEKVKQAVDFLLITYYGTRSRRSGIYFI